MGRNEDALSDYTNALRLDPNFTECRYCCGLALKRMGRFDEALEDYSQVLEENPRHGSAYNNRGEIIMSQGSVCCLIKLPPTLRLPSRRIFRNGKLAPIRIAAGL
jgi:tetratricopeptide (TPR) repeat protein